MILWLASYPRSGNTLLRAVLNNQYGLKTYSLYDDKTDIGANERVADAVGHVSHGMSPADFRAHAAKSDDLFLIKTHDAPQDSNKAIYVVRDGRSAVVSYFHYLKEIAREAVRLRDVILGDVPFGTWAGHYLSWSPVQRPSTLVLRYEDLVNDLHSQLPKISHFLEREPLAVEEKSFADFRKLDSRFFRAGSDQKNVRELNGDDLDLFWELQGGQLIELGYGEPSRQTSSTGTDIARVMFKLRNDAASAGQAAQEQRATIEDLSDWAARLEASLQAEKQRVTESQTWARQADERFVTERKRADGLEVWARQTDERLAAERERAKGLETWARQADERLVTERKRAEGLAAWAKQADERLAAERVRAEEFQSWARKAEEALATERERSAGLLAWATAAEERGLTHKERADRLEILAADAEKDRAAAHDLAVNLQDWAQSVEMRLEAERALLAETRQWAEKADRRAEAQRELAQENERWAKAAEAMLAGSRADLAAAEALADRVSQDLAGLRDKAIRERREWVELVEALSDRIDARALRNQEARDQLSASLIQRQMELADAERERVRLEAASAELANRLATTDQTLARIRATRLWRMRMGIVRWVRRHGILHGGGDVD